MYLQSWAVPALCIVAEWLRGMSCHDRSNTVLTVPHSAAALPGLQLGERFGIVIAYMGFGDSLLSVHRFLAMEPINVVSYFRLLGENGHWKRERLLLEFPAVGKLHLFCLVHNTALSGCCL